MVVGTTPYRDTKEAYPLDRKTLRSIALRSFLMQSSINSETGSSLGWTWAIAPGLKKIHTDPADLAVAMGQNLEYSEPGSLFCTFVMGVSLAAEAQKADPAVIRSLRTGASLAAHSLEKSFLTCLIMPGLLSVIVSVLSDSVLAVAVFAVLTALIGIVLRFVLISYGYAKGAACLERLMTRRDDLTHAARIGGIFMIGAMSVIMGALPAALNLSAAAAPVGGLMTTFNAVLSFNYALPGIFGAAAVLLSYHLIVRKNWSLPACAVLLALAGFVIGFVI